VSVVISLAQGKYPFPLILCLTIVEIAALVSNVEIGASLNNHRQQPQQPTTTTTTTTTTTRTTTRSILQQLLLLHYPAIYVLR